MSNLVTSLPSRPLPPDEVEQFGEQFEKLKVWPMSFLPEAGVVVSLLLATSEHTHLVAFNDHEDGWERITKTGTPPEGGNEQLEDALEEWIDDTYDGQFENHFMEYDPDNPEKVTEESKAILENDE